MARSGVQYEDVKQAIDTLMAKGEAPSVQKIRDVLGTGSFTTISDHLREWRARREVRAENVTTQAMPEPVQQLAEGLWEKAQDAAGAALAEYREAADREVTAARAAVQDARREAEDAEQREAALSAHLASIEQRLEARSAALATAEVERDQAIEKARRLGERLARSLQQLERLQAESELQLQTHQQALGEREAQHQARQQQEEQRHEAAEARLMSLLDEARQERLSGEKRYAANLRQLESRQEALKQELQEMRAILAKEEKQHRETQWARTRAEERAETMRHEQSLLQARIDDQKRHLEEQASRLRLLESEISRRLWQGEAHHQREERGAPATKKGPANTEPAKVSIAKSEIDRSEGESR
ncbi:DNA-binding protein [Halomonas sp. ANAO-440]|uniref:DNA-binding protein n=1 Tax=Halomonas sp. ANAO-440 TaxID=2861360 RepID=UPI001CAA7A69|nr:DNA-binding protein [Halomonas sp. ANAO-440]MBZ0330396.1 DNA-binding protein [Halomonas sp. ANAO-440]